MSVTDISSLNAYTGTNAWVTHGVALADGVCTTGHYLTIEGQNTQTDVKCRWPSGALKHAIISAKIPSAGNYKLQSNTADVAGSPFTPTAPTVSTVFVISGTTYTATLPAYSGASLWLDGPLCREWRVVVTPTTAGAVPHANLRVIYDIRSYVDAATHRIAVTVANTIDSTAGDLAVYNVTINVAGSPVYTKSSVTHYYLTKWIKRFTTAALTESVYDLNLTPFYASQALIQHDSAIVADTTDAAVSGSDYDIMTWGSMSPDMGAPGGSAENAPTPDYWARYYCFKRRACWDHGIKQADLTGSWSWHITGTDSLSLKDVIANPPYWADARATPYALTLGPTYGPVAPAEFLNGGPVPRGFWDKVQVPAGSLQNGTHVFDMEHFWCLCFTPYILTGDRYYLDQIQMWGNGAIINRDPNSRGYASGKHKVRPGTAPRAIGWGLRNLVETAWITPDADTYKSYFETLLQDNLNDLDNYATTVDGGPLSVPIRERCDTNIGWVQVQLWGFIRVAFALDRASQFGYTPTIAARDQIIRFQLLLFTSTTDGYDRSYGMPYYLHVGTSTGGPSAVFTWYPDILTVWKRNYGTKAELAPEVSAETNALYPNGSPAASPPVSYGREARLALQIAARDGFTGASAAAAYLEPLIDLSTIPGWAILAAGTPTAAEAPTITADPANIGITTGTSTVLTVTATGTTPLTYQWYQGASGTTTTTVGTNSSSFTTPLLALTTQYWVRVTNSVDHDDSATATVTVSAAGSAPTITTQPVATVVLAGGSTTLAVVAVGVNLVYQWYIGTSGTVTSAIVGAVQSSFITPPLAATTSYWCRVSNNGGHVDTNTTTITVATVDQITLDLTLTGNTTCTLSLTGDNTHEVTQFTFDILRLAERQDGVLVSTASYPGRVDTEG